MYLQWILCGFSWAMCMYVSSFYFIFLATDGSYVEGLINARCVCTSVYQQLCFSEKKIGEKLFVRLAKGAKCKFFFKMERNERRAAEASFI